MSRIGAAAVPPRSRAEIRGIAVGLRQHLSWSTPRFPIVEVLEHVLPTILDGYELQICAADELGVNHGLTYPDDNLIKIRGDVYERACDGEGRDRMTLAHELGHLVLHRNLGLARLPADAAVPTYMDSEWQANCFGGELLVCATHMHLCSTMTDVEIMFGVSGQAAATQWETYKREGIIRGEAE